jgi:hypothetical protein
MYLKHLSNEVSGKQKPIPEKKQALCLPYGYYRMVVHFSFNASEGCRFSMGKEYRCEDLTPTRGSGLKNKRRINITRDR